MMSECHLQSRPNCVGCTHKVSVSNLPNLSLFFWPSYRGLAGGTEPPIWHAVCARIRGLFDGILELISAHSKLRIRAKMSASSCTQIGVNFQWDCFGIGSFLWSLITCMGKFSILEILNLIFIGGPKSAKQFFKHCLHTQNFFFVLASNFWQQMIFWLILYLFKNYDVW